MIKENCFCVTLDIDANIIEFGGLATSISGYSADEVKGKNWFEVFIPDETQNEIQDVFKSFLNGDLSFWQYRNEITCKDGTKQMLQWKNSLKRDTLNNPVSISSEGSLI